ncbi:MAG: helix-turn-helix domain-containing protein, partial [Gemmatimonadota bacterium]|nr:helix-turn-helix domain-containing protein [Gemmatimonadota bacterium]
APLRVLARAAGRPVTSDTLLRRGWEGGGDADPNLVRIFVKNLRRKLGDNAADPVWIFNERGVGYRMAGP